MNDLIFVSMENWDEVWRRNQFICAGLARRYPKMKLLFVGLPRDVSYALRTGNLKGVWNAALQSVPGRPNILVTRPLKFFPNTLVIGRRLNEVMMRLQVRRAARRWGIRHPILWLNPHSAVHMVGRMGEKGVVYDITDDWISLTQSPALKRLTEAQDLELCQKADAVIVCSQRLFELKNGIAHDLSLIPNGVESSDYAQVLDGAGPLPQDAVAWSHPVLGYTGTIHPDRVDVELVTSIAEGLVGGTVVLIGPDLLSEADRARLRQCGNVILKGPVPYAELQGYMRAFDVCITPHQVTPFTESLNPIKLWEYLAAGKPIISTNIAGFRDFPQLVRIASDTCGFLRAAQDALHEDPSLPERRRTEARRHSWDSRLDAVEDVLCRANR